MCKKKTLYLLLLMVATALQAAAKDRFTLVIDPGHGGHDAGAVGSFSKEKNTNLNVALAFGKYVENNCPDVRVIYTRKTDIFIPLHTRADIANRNKADLFISIHTNSLPGGRIARGLETYTLGMHRANDNLEVAKRENSVILVEKDYKQRYQGFDPRSSESYIMFELIQDKNMEKSVELARAVQRRTCASANRPNKGVKQAGFLVLRETSMPSCLIELGFISTADEERFLNSKDGIDKLGFGIYQAFLDFKKKSDAATQPSYQIQEPEKVNVPTIATPSQKQQAPKTKNDKTDNKPLTNNIPQAKPKTDNKTQKNQVLQELANARAGRTTVDDNNKKPSTDVDSILMADPTRNNQTGKDSSQQGEPIMPASKPTPKAEVKPVEKPVHKTEVRHDKTVAPPTPKAEQNAETAAKPVQKTEAEPVKTATKPTVKTVEKPANTVSTPQQTSGQPIFKVQILASSARQNPNSPMLKDLENVDYYEENGMFKYTVGASTDYQEIYQLRKSLSERFPEAFIIAFKDGRRANVQQAIQEYRRNKNKK